MSFLPNVGSDWTIEDINRLVELEVPESSTLEFKEALPLKQDASGWITKRKIHDSERDGIAKEIVAMANAYGGDIIVGIEESEDSPKRAKSLAPPIPDLPNLLDRLRAALSSVINPPISGLRIEGILAKGEEGSGYIAISVPTSTSAPHGVGRPPLTYIRRDDRSEAATMQDLQNLFWDSRMKLQRVEQEVNSLSDLSKLIPNSIENIGYRFFAIPEFQLNLTNIADDLFNGRILDPSTHIAEYRTPSVVEIPRNSRNWRPIANGVDFQFGGPEYHENGRWQITHSGTIFVEGEYPPYKPSHSESYQVYPGGVAKGLGHLIGMAQVLAKKSGYESDWIIGFGVRCDQEVQAVSGEDRFFRGGQEFKGNHVATPIRIGNFENWETLELISRKVWETFHLIKPDDQALLNGMKEMGQFLGKRLE